MPHVLHVVVVLQEVQHLLHFDDGVLVGDGGVGIGHHLHVGGDELVALLFQVLPDAGEVVGLGGDFEHVLVGGEIRGAGLQGVAHHGVLVQAFPLDGDDALLVEHEGHAAGGAQVAAKLVESVAHIGGGAVPVVGKGLHDHGHAAGAVAFVGDVLEVVVVALAGRLFDDPVDVVVGDVGSLGLGDGVPQAGVRRGVGAAALFYGHGQLTANLGEDFRLGAVGLFLFPLDVVPFRMS